MHDIIQIRNHGMLYVNNKQHPISPRMYFEKKYHNLQLSNQKSLPKVIHIDEYISQRKLFVSLSLDKRNKSLHSGYMFSIGYDNLECQKHCSL